MNEQYDRADSLELGAPPPTEFQFYDRDTIVARMWFEDGVLRFEGEMDVACEGLFELVKDAVDEYVEERVLEALDAEESV